MESRSAQYGLFDDLQLNDFGGQTCENTLMEEEVILEAAYRILERRKKLADEARVQFTGNVFTPRTRKNPPSVRASIFMNPLRVVIVHSLAANVRHQCHPPRP